MLVVTSNNPRLPFIAKHRKSLRHLRSPNNSKFNSKFFSSNSNRPFHRALLPQDLVVRLLLVRPPSLLSRHNSQSPRRQHDRKATLDSSLSDGLISQFLSLYTPRHSSWALANIFFSQTCLHYMCLYYHLFLSRSCHDINLELSLFVSSTLQ